MKLKCSRCGVTPRVGEVLLVLQDNKGQEMVCRSCLVAEDVNRDWKKMISIEVISKDLIWFHLDDED